MHNVLIFLFGLLLFSFVVLAQEEGGAACEWVAKPPPYVGDIELVGPDAYRCDLQWEYICVKEGPVPRVEADAITHQ